MKRPYLIALLCVGIIGLLALILPKIYLSPQRMPALVTSQHYRPNMAEDGYSGLTVRLPNGQKYEINTTAFLNVADGFSTNIDCLPDPKAHTGDVVIFNLPKEKYRVDTFTTCYEKGESGYFIKVIPTKPIMAVVLLVAAVCAGWYLRQRHAKRA